MTAATFLMTAALAAQAPASQQPNTPPQQPNTAPQQQPPSQPQQRSESSAGKITVSGCIAKAAQPAQGFVLENATSGSASSTSGSTVGTTGAGAPSASTSASAGLTYRLDADNEKLTPHVGHRVEIVGTSAPMADSSAARSAEPGRPAPPSLKVESIKMVSQTCSTK
jgi:glucose/arabinose dehydrogenase